MTAADVHKPEISIIIPTHNRCHSLLRLLTALSLQRDLPAQFEVIVAANGCQDDTVAMARRHPVPYALRVLDLPGQGAAAARNAGAACAAGELLIFLDDDIEPTPQLVAAHWQAHQAEVQRIVIGYLPPQFNTQQGLLRLELQRWWEDIFAKMRRPDHRGSYRDLLSGNFSIRRDFFASVQGFDPAMQCCEDYELGLRLLKAGGIIYFAPSACGYHHETRALDGILERKYQEGIADVALGQRHPEIKSTLLVSRIEGSPLYWRLPLYLLTFYYPVLGARVIVLLRQCLFLLEQAQLTHLWRFVLDCLMGYWYYRGLASQLKSPRALFAFLQAPKDKANGVTQPPLEINLALGLDAAELRLDRFRPASVRLCYGKHILGEIPALPGVEQLHGRHLRPILACSFAHQLANALIDTGALHSLDNYAWFIEYLRVAHKLGPAAMQQHEPTTVQV